jgi:hypothetical protein
MAVYGYCEDCIHVESMDWYDTECDSCIQFWHESGNKVKHHFVPYPIPWSEVHEKD